MPLTRDFKETVLADIRRNPGFRNEMLIGAVEELLAGDLAVARSMLRDVINATIGFENLGEIVGLPPKSLMRMFGPGGNPQAKNLFAVIAALQKDAGVQLKVTAARTKKAIRKAKPVRSQRGRIEAAAKHVRRTGQFDQPRMGFAEEPRPFKRG
jgi:DNA-binding phage protein